MFVSCEQTDERAEPVGSHCDQILVRAIEGAEFFGFNFD
jgi:hypothetical protein